MAAPMPYLEKTAINPVAPITIARSASFSVYDLNDTTFTTPLNVTRLSDGVTTTTLLSDSNGYLPDFTVIDRNSVVLRTADGQFKKTIVTSSPVQGPAGATGKDGAPGPQGTPGDVSTWQPNVYYPTQKPIVNPSGDLVVCTTAHTSGASYDASKFGYTGTFLVSADAASTYAPLAVNGSAVVRAGDLTRNVKDYGAKGDGAANDTAAIQAAHDALPASGGTIFFPHGKYLATSTITLTKPVTLLGEGSGDHTGGQGALNTGTTYTPTAQGSVIFTTSPTIDLIVVNASGFAATDLALVNTSTTAPTAGTGLRITRGDGAHLTRVRTAGFWNNVSFEQSEYASITDCLFIDPVNYGLLTRNLVTSDQGDMTVSGCAFSFSGSVNRTATAAIRWESGGGLKVVGSKINMGPRGGVGKFAYGINLAVADGVSTSVFTVTGSSIENTTGAGILVRPIGTTGSISKLTITGNEFSNTGVGIDIEGASATVPFKNVAISTNVVDSVTIAVTTLNIDGMNIGVNNLRVTNTGVVIGAGCQNVSVGRQVVLGSTANVIRNDSSTLFSDHTTGPVDIDWHDKRNIPTSTSTSTYTNLHGFAVSPYAAGVVELTISAIVQGVGAGTKVLRRSFTRGPSGTTCSVTTVGTDVASGANFDVNFDTSSTAGNIVAQIRLNATTGGTDINGSSTIDIKGDVNALNRN